MRTSNKKRLCFHNGQFRVSCGYVKDEDGQRRPKVFMLGKDERLANFAAEELKYAYKRLKSQQPKAEAVWDGDTLAWVQQKIESYEEFLTDHDDDEAEFQQLRRPPISVESNPPAKAENDPGLPSVSHLMLYAATELYVDHLEQRVQHNDLSDSNFKRQRQSMKQLKSTISDMPMLLLKYEHLQRIKLHFQARPLSKKKTPMEWETIKTTLSHIRAFFRWPGINGKWIKFDGWEQALRARKR